MARQRGEGSQLPALDLDQPGGRDARTMQEGRVLEGAGLLDANVQAEGGVCYLLRVGIGLVSWLVGLLLGRMF